MHTSLISQLQGGDFITHVDDGVAILGNQGHRTADMSATMCNQVVSLAIINNRDSSIHAANGSIGHMIMREFNDSGELPDFYHNYLMGL